MKYFANKYFSADNQKQYLEFKDKSRKCTSFSCGEIRLNLYIMHSTIQTLQLKFAWCLMQHPEGKKLKRKV